jgi:hypothetical protein
MASTKQYHFVVCFDEHDKTWRIDNILSFATFDGAPVYDPMEDGIDGGNGWYIVGENDVTYDKLHEQLSNKLQD